EICALTDTLVIDEDGVYDPGQYNDRLLLGFRGTMSKAELHWLHCRLVGGKLEKAQRGTLRFRLPVGFAYDAMEQVGLDPDEEIQHAVRQVFEVFDRSKSALAVVKYFDEHGLKIPTRLWQRERKGEGVWRRLRHARVLSILHNPFYAGAYVYGRTQTRQRPLPGEAPRIKGYTRQVKRDHWHTFLRDHHPGYISWSQFRCNQEQLDDNRTFDPDQHRGVVREGGALLQGIVGCGVCGRRMTVRYMPDGIRPIYVCAQVHKDFAGTTCQFMRGDGIDAAVRPAASSHVSEAERQGIIALVHDLPAVWHAKTTTHAERKHVMRLLIKDVMLTKLAQAVRVDVRWHTHACSTLEVPRPTPA